MEGAFLLAILVALSGLSFWMNRAMPVRIRLAILAPTVNLLVVLFVVAPLVHVDAGEDLLYVALGLYFATMIALNFLAVWHDKKVFRKPDEQSQGKRNA